MRPIHALLAIALGASPLAAADMALAKPHAKPQSATYERALKAWQASGGLLGLLGAPATAPTRVVHRPAPAKAPAVAKAPQKAVPLPPARKPAATEAMASIGPEPQAERTVSSSLSSLVADARRYVGTNPTGRRSLWCGAFMDKVLRETGHRGGSTLAKDYLHYGRRITRPVIGALAVMGRRGGGHVGVVSGVDKHGNPIVISGNNRNGVVGETQYSKWRIIAYVLPDK